MQKTWYHQQLEKHKEEIYPKACLSKFHFTRLFKKLYGITPNQHLTKVRLEKAKVLLQNGATVSTACFSVGFDSTTTFAGLFKKNTGSNPSSLFNRPLPPAAIPTFIFLKKQY